jgi:low temperature requirement protein LtrA
MQLLAATSTTVAPRLRRMAEALHHHTVRMGGRDPHERHRAATTLELLFDLTFVIAFGTAANELAHFLAEDHIGAGIGGFLFATFAVSWAWINYSWFASAYDNDDWIYRLTTMVQMVGVLILALGLPDMFESLEHGDHVDNKVMVLGYIVMRVPMLAQWARAARQDPERRRICLTYITSIVVSQLLWCLILFADVGIRDMFLLACVPLAIELVGPIVAERRLGGTPWHAHHMAERYGLLVIIALGEGLIGTMASLSAVVGPHGPGWSTDVAVLGLAGTALTFGMWWIYFIVPCGEILHARRERSFGWGYGHIPLFGATVAVGAGLHVAAYYVEQHTLLGTTATVLTVAIPVAAYVLGIFLLYAALTRSLDPFHLLLIIGSAALVVASVVMAGSGAPMEWCIAVLALTPWVTVLGYETVGHRHNEAVLAALEEE